MNRWATPIRGRRSLPSSRASSPGRAGGDTTVNPAAAGPLRPSTSNRDGYDDGYEDGYGAGYADG